MSLWVPPRVAEVEANRQNMVDAEVVRRLQDAKRFEQDLRKIDPYLDVVWVPEGAGGPGLVPGRWHIRRRNPGTVHSYMPVLGPDGAYRDLDSGVIEELRRSDLWNGEAQRYRMRREAQELAARERAKDREREELLEEFAFRLKAKESPGVLFGDNKWTWRAGARKAA